MATQVLAADQRTIAAIRRADGGRVDTTGPRRQIRVAGGGAGGSSSAADHAWVFKITGAATAGGASYNGTVHETLDGAAIGTGILQVAEKHIAETLATGRVVAAMPHNLVITSVVGSEGV
jgi:hypothetical protein